MVDTRNLKNCLYDPDIISRFTNGSVQDHEILFDHYCIQDLYEKAKSNLLKRYELWEEIIYTFIYFVISLVAIIGNSLVILAVIRKKEMRTNRNILVVNLALSNLMLAFVTIPFLWLPSISLGFSYSKFFCKFANALPGSNIYCSTLTICVIAIDRYYSIKKIHLMSKNRGLRAIIISIFIWIVALLLSFPLLIYYDIVVFYLFKDIHVYADNLDGYAIRSYGWRTCKIVVTENNKLVDTETTTHFTIKVIVSLLQFLFIYIIPLIVLSIYNAKLTRFLKMNANINMNNRKNLYMSNGNAANNKLADPLNRKISFNNLLKSEKTLKDAKATRRSRTTILLILMAISYAVLWLPFTIISIVIDFKIIDIDDHIIEQIDQACKLISILSICVNPLLYGFLNTNFHREFTEIFKSCIYLNNVKKISTYKTSTSSYS